MGVVACNVFATIEQCESDADCGSGSTCDSIGRFCVKAVAPDVDAGDSATDAAEEPETKPLRCDPTDPFDAPVLVKGFESTPIISARLTDDEKAVFFSKLTGCSDETCYDLYLATREGRDKPFSPGGIVGNINCDQTSEYSPSISNDGLYLFFESSRLRQPDAGACGNDVARIWSAKRGSKSAPWETPTLSGYFSDPDALDTTPYLNPRGTKLYFVSSGREAGLGNQDIWEAEIQLGTVLNVGLVTSVSSADAESSPVISFDDNTLYFARDPLGGGERRIWVARRTSAGASFGTPTELTQLNTRADQIPTYISDDDCRLYFSAPIADGGGGLDAYRLWVAERRKR